MTARLVMLVLEDRSAPAVFTVTTAADNGNNAAPTPGSLRAAILTANNVAGADTIQFAIPGAGVQTITPPTPLPAITDPVTLDATTEGDFAGVPVIELSGTGAGAGANGFTLSNHTGSVVRGFTIDNFSGAGIL